MSDTRTAFGEDDDLLLYGIKALNGYDNTLDVWERLEDVFGTERAGMVAAALCELGEDEIREGSR